MQAVATRYNGTTNIPGFGPVMVKHYEVWNEPNLQLYMRPQYKGKTPLAGKKYAQMVNLTTPVVRAANPRAIVIAGVTGPKGKLRDLCVADGFDENEILSIPDGVAGRFSVFTAAGLLPAAVVGLDILALLLGASAMTRRFLEEPFDRNPVLQYAAINHLLAKETGKNTRVMAVWSKKLESIGHWHDHLVSESLGKQNLGPTPMTIVHGRDLHTRGQQHQEGERNKVINNLFVRGSKHAPIQIGMADRNEDGLNSISRRTMPDILAATFQGANQAYASAARPTNDLVLPTLSEHTIGQLMQMLMLATVVEARLLGVNPYGQSGTETAKQYTSKILTNSISSVEPKSHS